MWSFSTLLKNHSTIPLSTYGFLPCTARQASYAHCSIHPLHWYTSFQCQTMVPQSLSHPYSNKQIHLIFGSVVPPFSVFDILALTSPVNNMPIYISFLQPLIYQPISNLEFLQTGTVISLFSYSHSCTTLIFYFVLLNKTIPWLNPLSHLKHLQRMAQVVQFAIVTQYENVHFNKNLILPFMFLV